MSLSVAYKYPFYGVQWHPEKNVFEWTTHEDIPHSLPAVQAAQAMANFFVQEGIAIIIYSVIVFFISYSSE